MDSLKFKRTKTKGKKPTDLTEGEIALNLTDRTVLCQNGADTVEMLGSIEQRYGMPKAVFEANREANRHHFANSGVVSGKGSLEDGSTRIHYINNVPFNVRRDSSLTGTSNYIGMGAGENSINNWFTSEFVIDGILFTFPSSTYNIVLPDAPDGAQLMPSIDGEQKAMRDFNTFADDRYPDADGNATVASDSEEAVKRCFGGLVSNHDFRLGDVGTSSNSGFYTESNSTHISIDTDGAHFKGFGGHLKINVDIQPNTNYEVVFHIKTATSGNIHVIQYGQKNSGVGDASIKGFSTAGWHRIQWNSDNYTEDYGSDGHLSFYSNATSSPFTGTIDYIEFRPISMRPILERVDFVGLEMWIEAVEDTDAVFPHGLLNHVSFSSAMVSDKLPSLTAIGTDHKIGEDSDGNDIYLPQSYLAYGAWDSTDYRDSQKLWKWSALTDSEKIALLQDPQHHLYWDGDKNQLMQVRFRYRTCASTGNNFKNCIPTNASYLFDGTSYVAPQGSKLKLDTDLEKSASGSEGIFAAHKANWDNGLTDYDYLYHATTKSGGGDFADCVDGQCFMYPLALIQRRNKGAYSLKNPYGAGCFGVNSTGRAAWYDKKLVADDETKNSKDIPLMNHFIFKDNENGYASQHGGFANNSKSLKYVPYMHDSGWWYDWIAKGQINDLRLSALVTSPENRQREWVNKLLNNETPRGSGIRKTLKTKHVHDSVSQASYSLDLLHPKPLDWDGDVQSLKVYIYDGSKMVDVGKIVEFIDATKGSDGKAPNRTGYIKTVGAFTRPAQECDVYVCYTDKGNYIAPPHRSIYGAKTNLDSVFDDYHLDILEGEWMPFLPDASSIAWLPTSKNIHGAAGTDNRKRWRLNTSDSRWTELGWDSNSNVNRCHIYHSHETSSNVSFVHYNTFHNDLSPYSTNASKPPASANSRQVTLVSGQPHVNYGGALYQSLFYQPQKDDRGTVLQHYNETVSSVYPPTGQPVWTNSDIDDLTHTPLPAPKNTNTLYPAAKHHFFTVSTSGMVWLITVSRALTNTFTKDDSFTFEETTSTTQSFTAGTIYYVKPEHGVGLEGSYVEALISHSEITWSNYGITADGEIKSSPIDENPSSYIKLATPTGTWSYGDNSQLNWANSSHTDDNGNACAQAVRISRFVIGVDKK